MPRLRQQVQEVEAEVFRAVHHEDASPEGRGGEVKPRLGKGPQLIHLDDTDGAAVRATHAAGVSDLLSDSTLRAALFAMKGQEGRGPGLSSL